MEFGRSDMIDVATFLVGLLKWAWTALFAVALYMFKDMQGKIGHANSQVAALQSSLSDHKLEDSRAWLSAEQRYAKEETLQNSLARIHERIDDMAKRQHESHSEIMKHLLDLKGSKK